MICSCAGRGLVKIAYESGEPFDIAICHCRMGQRWEAWGFDAVRMRLHLSAEHQIGLLEDFDVAPVPTDVPETFIEAGRTQRAKL